MQTFKVSLYRGLQGTSFVICATQVKASREPPRRHSSHPSPVAFGQDGDLSRYPRRDPPRQISKRGMLDILMPGFLQGCINRLRIHH
jgi:hypothetical protein